jgi:hypothetical protein
MKPTREKDKLKSLEVRECETSLQPQDYSQFSKEWLQVKHNEGVDMYFTLYNIIKQSQRGSEEHEKLSIIFDHIKRQNKQLDYDIQNFHNP